MSGPSDARPLVFGEVLFDRFPDGSRVLGGAPFNVAWHLQGFALRPLFVSRVGQDAEGSEIRSAMSDWAMDLHGLQMDAEHPTGAVQVSLEGGQPSYEILPEQAYDHIDGEQLTSDLSAVPIGLVYHGTLALRSPNARLALQRLLEAAAPQVFVDVNLRAPWWAAEALPGLLERASWAKLNDEELKIIAADAGLETGDLEAAAQALLERFDLDLLVLTLGADGAVALGRDGHRASARPEADLEVVDTVGAGDGFASVVITGLVRGWPMQTTLARAQAFASLICMQRGAVIRDASVYRGLLADWEA